MDKAVLSVPPEDPHAIANAVLKALSDDHLVDPAAGINAQTSRQRLEQSMIKANAVRMYQEIINIG